MRLKESFTDGKISFNPAQLEKWRKVYGICGHHSAVQICRWTKNKLLGKGTCYKEVFYGVEAHRCAQISPAAAWCHHACIYCWRPMEWYSRTFMKPEEVDPPNLIIKECVKVRKQLLSGFGGNQQVNKKLFKEAYEFFPSHWAISLSGEPTIYPLLPELVDQLMSHPEVKSVFVVTNGMEPEMMKKVRPTQLYLSLSAYDEESFAKINRSILQDGWERMQRALEVLKTHPSRTIIRITLIAGINDKEHKKWAELIEKAKPDFIEVKGYTWIGQSRMRLKQENMPTMKEIKTFGEKLSVYLPEYQWEGMHVPSRVVLYKHKNAPETKIVKQ